MTNQPDWECIGQLGDADPIEHGGYWILRDKTGVYPEEGEFLVVPEDEDGGELSPDGRVMEMLSEHTLEGWLEGWWRTG